MCGSARHTSPAPTSLTSGDEFFNASAGHLALVHEKHKPPDARAPQIGGAVARSRAGAPCAKDANRFGEAAISARENMLAGEVNRATIAIFLPKKYLEQFRDVAAKSRRFCKAHTCGYLATTIFPCPCGCTGRTLTSRKSRPPPSPMCLCGFTEGQVAAQHRRSDRYLNVAPEKSPFQRPSFGALVHTRRSGQSEKTPSGKGGDG